MKCFNNNFLQTLQYIKRLSAVISFYKKTSPVFIYLKRLLISLSHTQTHFQQTTSENIVTKREIAYNGQFFLWLQFFHNIPYYACTIVYKSFAAYVKGLIKQRRGVLPCLYSVCYIKCVLSQQVNTIHVRPLSAVHINWKQPVSISTKDRSISQVVTSV